MFKYLLLFFPVFMYAQNDLQKIDSVYAIINYSGTNYYSTDSGLVVSVNDNQKDINDFYTDYYRKIYGDSTIQNPNYIIPGKGVTIIPLIDIGSFIKNNSFNLNYGDLIQLEQNKYSIKPESLYKIEQYLQKPKLKK